MNYLLSLLQVLITDFQNRTQHPKATYQRGRGNGLNIYEGYLKNNWIKFVKCRSLGLVLYLITSSFSGSSDRNWDQTTKRDDNGTTFYDGDCETVDEHKNHDTKHTIPDNNFPSMPDICNGKIDAVATLRNELFVFKDQVCFTVKNFSSD